jgi:PAS domain S-box-containing protein
MSESTRTPARADRLRIEEDLRQSEALYHSTIEAMHDMLHVVDRDYRVVLCNSAFSNRLKELGIGGEPVGAQLFELLPFLPRSIREAYDRVFASGEVVTTENRFEFNEHRWIAEARRTPIRDAQGQVVRVVSILRDVTERRRLEAELTQATKMESVARLAGGIAHDFNNLMTAISAHAGFALRTIAPDSTAADDLEQVIEATKRAATLTRQLLAFSRRQVLEPRSVQLADLLPETARLVRRAIPESIELVTDPDPGLWNIKIDPTQIEQVLLILAVNASDAMPRGGSLVIEAVNTIVDEKFVAEHPGSTAGELVCLSVTDTGVGMNEEVMAHLFEPFFTTKEQGKGSGLGLATVYGTVKQHHGYITVESAPGKGSTFRIYLPRTLEPVEPNRVAAAIDALPRGTETILVVEDEPAVRRALVRILRRLGYTILQAANGEQARGVAEQVQGPLHLVVTDVVMPVMGGVELSRKLRERRPDLPVLFVSAYQKGSLTEDGELDADAPFLRKPFEPETLAVMVRRILGS